MSTVTVKETGNPSNSLTSPGWTLADEFLPVVELMYAVNSDIDTKKQYQYKLSSGELIFEDEKKKITLSEYIESSKREVNTLEVSIDKKAFMLPFHVLKGNEDSDDIDGILKISSSLTDEQISINKIENIKNKKQINFNANNEFKGSYGSRYNIWFEVSLEEATEFFIDFHASDDADDSGLGADGELSNVHCGRIKIVFIDNRPKNVDIIITNTIIRDGIVSAYPDSDGKKYIVPTYKMNVIGINRMGKPISASFEVIRFGVQRDETKNIKARIVGLSDSQSYKLNWVDYLGGSWQVKGDWLIHEGAEDPTTEAWGAIGCIEVCGVNGWNEFNSLLKELTRIDDFEEISVKKLLTVKYLPVTSKPTLKIK